MKMIATRELAANSGQVMKELDKEGVLVITKDGKPRSILLTTSDATLMEDLRDGLYTRARRDLMKSQMTAAEAGSALTMDEIDAESGCDVRCRSSFYRKSSAFSYGIAWFCPSAVTG